MRACPAEDLLEHNVAQNPGVRVVAGAMVTIEEDKFLPFEPVLRTMPKRKIGELLVQSFQDRFVGDPPERYNRFKMIYLGDRRFQK